MNIELGQRLAIGGDSVVYRAGDKIVKVYDNGGLCMPPTQEQVQLYGEITNEAYRCAVDNPIFVYIDQRVFSVVVNPVDEVREEGGRAVIVAPLVEGDSVLRAFEPCEARKGLLGLSRELSQRLDVEGIEITPGNAKFFEGRIVITDLCAAVKALKRKSG